MITLTHDEILQIMSKTAGELLSQDKNTTILKADPDYISPFAAYLMNKADMAVTKKDGTLLSKSDVEAATLDFTQGRTLTEEEAEVTVRFIFDKSPWLSLFNSRNVNKLVVPIQGRSITKENLVSNEQAGTAVTTVNRRIVHNFGINLFLKNIHLQKNIPLQTVIDNLYNPNFETETMNDVAIALANDILLLATNGLEYAAYSSSENFYDLNRGFVRILQLADGKNTNTYGDIQISGWMAKALTPQKVDADSAVGDNYTATNLLALMNKMYKAMPMEYRNDSNNVWMMSQIDADLYADARSDMTAPSNTIRETNLTGGIVPNFKGRKIVVLPDMYSINETHKYQSSVPGAIIFGNPKNIDIVMSGKDIVRSQSYDARGSEGAVFEYDLHAHMDVQIAKPESFVVAFDGATVSTPYFVTEAGAATGQSGAIATSSSNTYNNEGDDLEVVPYCDNTGAVIVRATETMASMTYTQALDADDAEIVEQGTTITLDEDTYFKAYHPNMTASTEIFFDVNV
jgi:hypothetical protein